MYVTNADKSLSREEFSADIKKTTDLEVSSFLKMKVNRFNKLRDKNKNYILNFWINLINGSSQQYIFTILIPFKISEVNFILSSAIFAAFVLK